MGLTEIDRLLGKQTAGEAEKQALNRATNPDVAQIVQAKTRQDIASGHISPNGPTSQVRRFAISGQIFGQGLDPNRADGVCMDDVTPLDR